LNLRFLSAATYVLISLIGGVAFLYPFWQSAAAIGDAQLAHSNDAPLVTTLLISLSLAALFLDTQTRGISTKHIALLGMLVAINAVLRLAETALPGPFGFTPIFFLIVLSGYVFGARFGFLMGALTLLVSALITGGVGPWLPYQMFTAGWMGLSAGLLPKRAGGRIEILALTAFAALWGFCYGIVINIWFWPFARGAGSEYFLPGMSVLETLTRYAAFYASTSLLWDVFAALGNIALFALFGAPTLRAMRRFHARFTFTYEAG
jgi:energy-coupling factor transport system substrate-specific component